MKCQSPMNPRRITFEHVVFAAAFLLGLMVRFTNLGSAPLTDSEASWALQALNFVKGGVISPQAVTPQPGYVVLTGILFAFFGSSNFLARFWPALAGSVLVLLPILISQHSSESSIPGARLIDRTAAVIMAFGLALTPGLTAASRQASGLMMAVAFLLLAVGLIYNRLPILAGIMLGLALLSGPDVITGLIILALTWALLTLTKRFTGSALPPFSLSGSTAIRLVVSMAFTILLIGTAFFRYPQGLATWFDTLPAYLGGWITPSGIPILRILLAMVIYQPAIVIFGLVAAVRGLFLAAKDQERRVVYLWLGWIVIALVMILAYPARQTLDLAWVIIPFSALAAEGIIALLAPGRESPEGDNDAELDSQPKEKIHPIAIIQALLLIVLMSLLWYSLASISRLQPGDYNRTAHFIVIIGILALGALTTVLIQLGWSWHTARFGLTCGILGGLILFSVSMLWGVVYLRPSQPQELWSPMSGPAEADLFINTLQDLSSWNTGRTEGIDIVSEVNSPSLLWILRNFPNTQYTDRFVGSNLPSILITRQEQETPTLAAAYRGQDFTWTSTPGWSGALPTDWIGWLTFRNAPVQQDKIILWARSDRFPGGTLSQSSGEAPLPEPATVPENDQQGLP
jgi:hypothetical protein